MSYSVINDDDTKSKKKHREGSHSKKNEGSCTQVRNEEGMRMMDMDKYAVVVDVTFHCANNVDHMSTKYWQELDSLNAYDKENDCFDDSNVADEDMDRVQQLHEIVTLLEEVQTKIHRTGSRIANETYWGVKKVKK